MGTFGSIARGLGQFGSDIGRGSELLRQQRIQEFEQQLAQIRSQMEQKRFGLEEQEFGLRKEEFGLREKQAKQPRVIGTHQDTFGNLYVVEQDPQSGQTSTRKILDAQTQDASSLRDDIEAVVQQVPKEHQARLQAIIKPYLDRGDYVGAMKLAGSYAEKIGAERPYSPEEQYLTALKQRLGRDLTPEEMQKAHEKFQPYGAQRIQILQGSLNERKTQDILTDVDKYQRRVQPYEHLISVGSNAEDYLNNPTGPGDVALLSAFVEASKPEKGFRWTQQEVNLIRGARGWVPGAQARVMTGYEGTLFGPKGSEQRKVMVDIIRRAAGQASGLRDRIKAAYIKGRPELKDFIDEQSEGSGGSGGSTIPPPPPGAVIDQKGP